MQTKWTPYSSYSGYCSPSRYDIIRPKDAVSLPSGISKRVLESGAVITFRQGSDAVIIQRKHENEDAFLYEILGNGATIDTSQVCTDVFKNNKDNKVKKIDVIIDGDKNRVISPHETYVAMKGNKNIIGSGSDDENIHIVSADNIFAKSGSNNPFVEKLKFGTLTRQNQKDNFNFFSV